jgi:hypothetical protein
MGEPAAHQLVEDLHKWEKLCSRVVIVKLSYLSPNSSGNPAAG